MSSDALRYLAALQGLYFLITGVWPLVSMTTFEAVTGPKTDDWLVRTVGVLVAVVGAVLILAGYRGAVTPEIAVLAVGCALGLTFIDVRYVSRRIIPPVYLMDAAAEVGFVLLWAATWMTRA